MKLTTLTRPLSSIVSKPVLTSIGDGDPEITGVTADSRRVRPGFAFVALAGEHADGHRYISSALAAGAAAIIASSSRAAQFEAACRDAGAALITADDAALALGALCSQFYGEPGRALTLVGVTGTNGKTTVTHLLETILRDVGRRVGLVGTLGQRMAGDAAAEPDAYESTGHTTPMAEDLQATLAQMRDAGADTVVMEVSSHALSQRRVYGCRFQCAIITNLTQDHLDFHRTMADYASAKALLFSGLTPPAAAVINLDDPWAQTFLEACPPGIHPLTYALENPSADVRAVEATYTIDGASFRAVTPQGERLVTLLIAGRFSVYNALAALAGALAMGVPLAAAADSLAAVRGVRGRFEVVASEPAVIVDYAHTPDGLENVLAAARQVTPSGGRLWVVFGCGGDRDATKRPKMGAIAERLADAVIVTSDNPRSEDPQQIISDILSGIQTFDAQRMAVNADRRSAIRQAIDGAGPRDVVVLAGKGHEDYQLLADGAIHFDDREEAQQYLASRRAEASRP
ncbi:MAG: UDP-N-acetylmuramoyl-L-alanyl-D-glutamate--2,6-diaminopimelate ligase [Vampirovibrionales bacterium]|nr:UDP-N-acetylmuramoyl-L-alanyl-D-glutamate--2,6-diaminopimelate ligase [Vampirovibrionales bacterium]